MRRVVLDSSALMTYFEGQRGASKVKELFAEAIDGKIELLMSVVNWGEVYYAIWRSRGRQAAQEALANVAQLPILIVDADREVTLIAAEFRAQHKLPYVDCFAAALAKLNRAAVMTSDADFAAVRQSVTVLNV